MSEEEESHFFKDCVFNFDRYKKKLFYQFLCLLDYINNETIIKKSLKLIFSFIIEIITKYINNSAILYHPKPYVFSLIKNLIKSENSYANKIIEFSCKSIVDFLGLKNSDLDYFFLNTLRLINTFKKLLDNNQKNFQNMLLTNNLELFYCIQKFIDDMLHFDIALDPNLYVINPKLIYHKKKSKKEKKDNKIFQSSSTKLLNNQVIFLDLFQISLKLIYLLWELQEKDKNVFLKLIINILQQNHQIMSRR